MAKRLSDTAALAGAKSSGGASGCKSINIDVREIENGFVTRVCSYGDGMDNYKSTERFTAAPPKISDPLASGPRPRSSGSLSSAIKSLK